MRDIRCSLEESRPRPSLQRNLVGNPPKDIVEMGPCPHGLSCSADRIGRGTHNMPRSRSETSKRALARIQRLCCLGVGSEMLMPDLIRQLNELIPLGGGFFLWMNATRQKTNSYGMGPIPTSTLYHKEF